MNYKNSYLILGASSDLGVELISELNSEKSESLFIAHYNSSKEKLEKIVMRNNNAIKYINCDLSNLYSAEQFIKEISSFIDAPTHIVHLAAMPFAYMKLKDFDEKIFIKNLNIQLVSFVYILKKFLPIMAKRKANDKVVVMLSSYVIGKPPKFMLDYIIVKNALLGLVKSLASDYEGKKININALSPSMIETKFLNNIDERIIQMVKENSPECRNATVKDIVPVIKFLLSDTANYMNGVNLNVSNGSAI